MGGVAPGPDFRGLGNVPGPNFGRKPAQKPRNINILSSLLATYRPFFAALAEMNGPRAGSKLPGPWDRTIRDPSLFRACEAYHMLGGDILAYLRLE
jgi:hypothetical protein